MVDFDKVSEYGLLVLLGFVGLIIHFVYPDMSGVFYLWVALIGSGTAGLIAERNDASRRTHRLILSLSMVSVGAIPTILYIDVWHVRVLGVSVVVGGVLIGIPQVSMAIKYGVVTIGLSAATIGALLNHEIAFGMALAVATIVFLWHTIQHANRVPLPIKPG